jgi:diguanylate cyclase (GGDEF)-like protein
MIFPVTISVMFFLKEIALILKSNIRKSDTVARIGGDEFILLLPQTGFEEGETVLHKLIEELRRRMDERKSKITISIGAITFLDSFPEVLSMIAKTDQLMYSAKAEGKNRVLHTKYE